MVDTERNNKSTIAGKGILKRRIFIQNDRPARETTAATAKPLQGGNCCVANVCKRYVTFDETITVKNDKDLVVRKPLKLELVIDNWKSNGAKTPPETMQPDPGIVRRLVDEFNTIDEVRVESYMATTNSHTYLVNSNKIPLTDSSVIESTSIEEDKIKEDKPVESRTNTPLCEVLEMVSLTTDDQ